VQTDLEEAFLTVARADGETGSRKGQQQAVARDQVVVIDE
jgi:hypothetical protein